MVRSWFLLSLLVAVGCSGSPQGPTIDLEAERQALMQVDGAWYESHESVDDFVTFLDDDAIMMPFDAPLARGESIRTTWEQMSSMPGFHLVWQATSAEVAERGDLGYTIGTFELTVGEGDAAMFTVGKYVTIWKKQTDGTWKVAVDCFNSDGPPVELE